MVSILSNEEFNSGKFSLFDRINVNTIIIKTMKNGINTIIDNYSNIKNK